MLRVAGVFARNSPIARKAETLATRAKDKKGGKGPVDTKPRATYDVSEAPPEISMERVAWFWNRFCLKEGEKPVELSYPWKEGEEPLWLKELTAPPETIVDPAHQLDPMEVGPRKYMRTIRRLKIKEYNAAISAKNFSVLKKNQKQLPP